MSQYVVDADLGHEGDLVIQILAEELHVVLPLVPPEGQRAPGARRFERGFDRETAQAPHFG